jgi:hypothetical protein
MTYLRAIGLWHKGNRPSGLSNGRLRSCGAAQWAPRRTPSTTGISPSEGVLARRLGSRGHCAGHRRAQRRRDRRPSRASGRRERRNPAHELSRPGRDRPHEASSWRCSAGYARLSIHRRLRARANPKAGVAMTRACTHKSPAVSAFGQTGYRADIAE